MPTQQLELGTDNPLLGEIRDELMPKEMRGSRTRVRICTETYGFARQKTRGGSLNLILISWMRFWVDF